MGSIILGSLIGSLLGLFAGCLAMFIQMGRGIYGKRFDKLVREGFLICALIGCICGGIVGLKYHRTDCKIKSLAVEYLSQRYDGVVIESDVDNYNETVKVSFLERARRTEVKVEFKYFDPHISFGECIVTTYDLFKRPVEKQENWMRDGE